MNSYRTSVTLANYSFKHIFISSLKDIVIIITNCFDFDHKVRKNIPNNYEYFRVKRYCLT